MTRLQGEYLEMFVVVKSTLMKFQAVWQTNSIVSTNVASLQAFIDDINAINPKRADKKHRGGTRPTHTANDLRGKLTSVGFRVKEALKIYYGINGMDNDERLFTYAKSKLVRMTKSDFYVAISGIIDRGTPLQAQLAPLGVTPQIIASLTQDAGKYYDLIFVKSTEAELQKGLTVTLADKINQCRLLLRNKMDSIIGTYEFSQPEMWSTYRILRRIWHVGGKRHYYSVIISGKVSDSATKSPLTAVSITPETKGKPAVSDDEGKFTVKMYKKDAKALLLKLDGYEDLRYELPAEVKEHKMRVDVKMKPSVATNPG